MNNMSQNSQKWSCHLKKKVTVSTLIIYFKRILYLILILKLVVQLLIV